LFADLSAKIREIRGRFKFHRTSKLTAVPPKTFCPAAGTCDTMMLAGDGCAGGVDGVTGEATGAVPGA
jgi:hypothetical protein